MFSRSKLVAAAAACLFAGLAVFNPGTAHAVVLSACGNVDLDANASCTIETSGGCTAQCTPLNFDLQCSANLEVSCSGQCTGSIDASCTSSCESSCTGGCTSGSFSCEGSCDADCEGHCSSECTSNGNQDQCTASCKSTCSANCSGSCTGQPPSCSPVTCQAECQGSCQAQANLDCQVKCQSSGYADCQTKLTGGCQTNCSSITGALYCNGQYVDVSADQLQACGAQLESLLNISVVGSASCDDGSCEAKGSASCGQIAPGAPAAGGILAVGLGLGIAGAIRRRVRKSKKA